MTKTILNLDSGTANYTGIKVAAAGSFARVSSVDLPEKREAVYQRTVGDEEKPMTIRLGWYPNPKANGGIGQTNFSMKISTMVENDDAETGFVLPGTLTVAWSMPGLSGVPNSANLKDLLGHAYTWLVPDAAGSPITDVLEEIKFGVVTELLEH
jgi:hypothetical protein